MTRRIAVLGTGANGGSTAASLVDAGCDVTVIDQWPAHIEAIRANGLKIDMKGEVTTYPDLPAYHLCDVATFTEPFDLVLLMSKAYDARWLACLIEPYLAEDGILVGAQNSMTAEDLASIVGAHRTVGCVVELSSELFEPGIVKRNTPPSGTWFAVGALDPSMEPRLAEVAEVIGHVGNVAISEEILSAKWMKLIVNAMTMPVRSMMGISADQVGQYEGARELMLRAGEEALAAGQARGYQIVPIFGLKSEEIAGTNRYLEMLVDKLFRDIGPGTKNAMYQDILKGRRTEADAINGLVVEAGREHGIETPVNAAFARIANQLAAGEIEPDPANLGRMLDELGR